MGILKLNTQIAVKSKKRRTACWMSTFRHEPPGSTRIDTIRQEPPGFDGDPRDPTNGGRKRNGEPGSPIRR